jgi:hypothetical protein
MDTAIGDFYLSLMGTANGKIESEKTAKRFKLKNSQPL